jgi:hypothetical protein
MQINYETIHFTFEFDSDWKNSPPVIEIKNNDIQIVAPRAIEGPEKIDCILNLELNKIDNVLQIIRSNHDECNSQICQLVTIKADDNNLSRILNHTKYYPKYPAVWYQEQLDQGQILPQFHKGWLSWGWNGVWEMSYTVPFYDWLLNEL